MIKDKIYFFFYNVKIFKLLTEIAKTNQCLVVECSIFLLKKIVKFFLKIRINYVSMSNEK